LLIVIACILTAMLASGCAGNGNIVDGRSFLHTDHITWYEYRENYPGVADKYSVYDVIYHNYQLGNATYNGTIVPHLLITDRYGGSHNVTYVNDNFFDPTGCVVKYSRTERFENGTVVMSGDDYNLSNSFTLWPPTYNILYNVWMNNFTPAGKETLTINGSVYECDMYRGYNESSGQTFLIWIDPSVPVPVKVSIDGRRESSELMSWG
jgi:hypothetical protein